MKQINHKITKMDCGLISGFIWSETKENLPGIIFMLEYDPHTPWRQGTLICKRGLEQVGTDIHESILRSYYA